MNQIVRFILLVIIGLSVGFGGFWFSQSDFFSGNNEGGSDGTTVSWDTLRGLNLETGAVDDKLKKLDGQKVRIPGFVVPLNAADNWNDIDEFVFVPSPAACIHVPPPPPNQMIHIKLENNATITPTVGMPYWVHGTLKVQKTDSLYGEISYQLGFEHIEEYKVETSN